MVPAAQKARDYWRFITVALVAIAAGLRLYDLTLAPMHNDEGVNGLFMTTLFRTGVYRYDPMNYHGPALYYLTLIVIKVGSLGSGKAALSTAALRSVPAIMGTAMIPLILGLRRALGAMGAVTAATLVAVSPGAVYFSRNFIHEMPFIFFTLALVAAVLRFGTEKQYRYLMLASASAALLFATKETAIISIIVLSVGYGCTRAYIAAMPPRVTPLSKAPKRKRAGSVPVRGSGAMASQAAGRNSVGGSVGRSASRPVGPVMLAVVIFAGIYVLFYSSLGSNFPQGVHDSVATFRTWGGTGLREHQHDWLTYLRWLWEEERWTLVPAMLGFAFALRRGANRFALFCGFWAFGMLAAYSLIPYKTPWLTLNISVPMALVAGYGCAELWETVRGTRPARVTLLLAIAVVPISSACQAVNLSFFRYDDDSQPYVYAHTGRQMFALLAKLEDIARQSGTGTDTGITIMSPDYWPLPWYLRDYSDVGYWGHVVPTDKAIVIAAKSQESELDGMFGDRYEKVGTYELRPGVSLVLYSRRDRTK